ncbi:MAG: hypothetical protein MJ116_02810 [Lachnospiraceae bacterium]|nr:hypothetical protein [Lachnospiraceae bacterium]
MSTGRWNSMTQKHHPMYVGPDLMNIGEKLKVRCAGEGARSLEEKDFVLVQKYPNGFGRFVSKNGYSKCFSWFDVSRIMSMSGTVDSDFSVSDYEIKK